MACFTELKTLFGGDPNIHQCCMLGRFYTIATPLFGGGYAIGSMGNDTLFPDIYPTKKTAEMENQDLTREYLAQIEAGERDEEDEWEGEVLELFWDGINPVVTLKADGVIVHQEDWRSMAGLR